MFCRRAKRILTERYFISGKHFDVEHILMGIRFTVSDRKTHGPAVRRPPLPIIVPRTMNPIGSKHIQEKIHVTKRRGPPLLMIQYGHTDPDLGVRG